MESERTRLRRPQFLDFEKMRVLESDPDVVRFTPMRIPQSEPQTRDRLNSQIEKQEGFDPFGIWLADEKRSGAFIGWFMLLPSAGNELELGFMLAQSQWGRGFASEIGRALIDCAKANGIARLTARTSIENAASIRVLEKLDFRYSKNISVSEKGFDGVVELKFFELLIG